MHPYQVLLKPLITEKTQWQAGYEQPQYCFAVDPKANKAQKKAVVQVKAGNRIALFEGVA